ncbi:hypothetical protein DH86_00004122, partial [Scytalidium sp. 3C]
LPNIREDLATADRNPVSRSQVEIQPPYSAGSVARGHSLTIVPFEGGSVKSEPSYPIQIDGTFTHGSDFIRTDPDGKFSRLQVTSVLKDKSGACLSYGYTGIITMNEAIMKVFSGAPDAKTTEFGNIAAHVYLESGDSRLQGLEGKVFVGSGRFVVEPGKPTVVEY